MALRNARDLYTRRNEGVSIWVVPADAIAASDPDAKGVLLRITPGQGLPARHVLHQERGREAPVSTTSPRQHTGAETSSGHGDISVGVPGAGASGDATASATRITPGNALRPEDIALAVSRGTAKPSEDVAEYALRLGDDALILAQRLGHWISRAPGARGGRGPRQHRPGPAGPCPVLPQLRRRRLGQAAEDDLAYFRREHEFRSAHLFEQPNGDFAVTIARQFVVSYYQFELYRRLTDSTDATLAGHRRQGRQGSGLPPRPQRAVGPAPGRSARTSPAAA